MLRQTRSKIAAKVAKIEVTDDFQFAKWLRVPQIYNEEVKQLYSYNDVEEIVLDKFQPPQLLKPKFKVQKVSVLASKPFIGVVKPKAYLIFFGLTRPQLFEMREKFLKSPDLKNLESQFIFSTEVINQSDIFIVKAAEVAKYDYQFSASPIIDYSQSNDKIAKDENYGIIQEPDISDQFANIPTPVITDHLASLVPEIYNIELLNEEKLENLVIHSRNFEVKQLKLPMIDKIEVPGIDDIIKSSTESFSIPVEEMIVPELKYFSSDINITSQIFKVKIDLPKSIVKKVVVKQKNLDTKIIDGLNDEKISHKKRENIRVVLSSYRELSWEEYVKSLPALSDYQNEGAKFLSETNFAFYSEELGYEKYNQSIAALNYLFKKGKIKSALIVSDNKRIKDHWENTFAEFGKGLSYERINPETTKNGSGFSRTWFLDLDDLPKIEIKKFDQIDIVIFDEQINLKSSSNLLDELIKKVEPHYIWLLSAIINQKYNKKYLEDFEFSTKVDFSYYQKSVSEIQNDNPVVSFKDIWLELDEMQKFEYDEALNQVREDLTKLKKNPNPIRFQSNIFTLIHKLKQILNFSSFRNISPKANLLIEQSEAIYRNKRKAIVFTQYDENGMKKIEKAFEMNNIKHVIARNGMSTEELKKTLSTYYDRSEIAILLTNLKPARLKINLSKIQYIINFDQWWNPITNWQTEDEIGLNEIVDSPVIVYNYFVKNSFEEQLKILMDQKGLSERTIIDNLKSETVSELILMDDWLSVFGLNENYDKQVLIDKNKILNQLQSLENGEYRTLMKSLFTFLGYRDISIMDIPEEQTFYIIGTARHGTTPVHLHGKCFSNGGLKAEDYEEVIHLKQGANEIKRKFVITCGTFSEKVPNGTTYLDGEKLANYILTLGIKSKVLKAEI